MKILAIIGSSKNGNTSEAVRYFERKMKEKISADFEYIYLSDYSIDFCRGCHNCIFLGEDKCSQHLVVQSIENKMLGADALILASPGYMFSVSGIMKNFLDHVAYNCHRPKYFGKKAYLISSCTRWQEKSVFAPMEAWLGGAGFNLVGKTFVEMLPFPLKENELDKIRKKSEKAAAKFYEALRKEHEIKPDLGGVIIFHVFRTLCKIAPQIFKADYKYFTNRNAYDKETKWYVPAKISFIKDKFAKHIERKVKKDLAKIIDLDKLKDSQTYFHNKL